MQRDAHMTFSKLIGAKGKPFIVDGLQPSGNLQSLPDYANEAAVLHLSAETTAVVNDSGESFFKTDPQEYRHFRSV